MIAALLAIAIVTYRLTPLLLPKTQLAAVIDPGCDLTQRACTARLADGSSLELSFSPRPLPVQKPMRVEVSTTGFTPTRVEIDFTGKDMNMGYNRSELAAVGPRRYVGDNALPVCISGGMAWIVTVIIETDRQQIVVPFGFETGPGLT